MQPGIFTVTCERIPKSKAYSVKFPYNEELIGKIRELPQENRKWSPGNMAWLIKVSSLLDLIKVYRGNNKIFFDFGSEDSKKVFIQQIKKIEQDEIEKKRIIDELNANKEKWLQHKIELETTFEKHIDKVHTYLKKDSIKLYPHQIVAALFVNETRSALISHEMGLGKTVVSILYAEMNDFEKVVVLTPNSLKFNYFNEVEKFTNSKAYIVGWGGTKGKKNKYTVEESKYIILNYDYFNPSSYETLLAKFNKLNIGQIDALIADECQKLKNSDSNTYKNFKKVFAEDRFKDSKVSKIFLSGTPAPNRAYELFNVLHQISPLDFRTKTYFQEYYCGMKYDQNTGWGYVTENDEQRLEELYHKIAPYTHRKRKQEVLTDLPDKIYQRIMLEMDDDDYKTYTQIEQGVANEFMLKETSNPLTIMIRLRQFTSALKVKYVNELIDNIIETGEKAIVVDYFKESLYKIKEIYGDIAGLHTGDQGVEERAEIVKKFQDPNSEMKIFDGSIQTCNYGLTLTAASKLFILTLPFSVGEYDQVSDRLHRIGQKDVVNIYPIIFRDTIDDYVFSSIEGKRREINKVMDNEDYVSNVGESVVSEVIAKIKGKYGK